MSTVKFTVGDGYTLEEVHELHDLLPGVSPAEIEMLYGYLYSGGRFYLTEEV